MKEDAIKDFVFLIEIQGGKQISMIEIMTEEEERALLSDGWDWRHENDGLQVTFNNGRANYTWHGSEIIPPWQAHQSSSPRSKRRASQRGNRRR